MSEMWCWNERSTGRLITNNTTYQKNIARNYSNKHADLSASNIKKV